MIRFGIVLVTSVALALPAWAEMRPVPRPNTDAGAAAIKAVAAPATSARPTQRGAATAQPARANGNFTARIAAALAGQGAPRAAVATPDTRAGLQKSARPTLRPARVARVAARTSSGAVCGRASVKATRVPAVTGRIAGCGIANPVKVTEVAGIALKPAATLECETAVELDNWVKAGVIPAVGRFGGGATSLRIVSHYSCRTRNSRRGVRLSEHAKGKAIDIAGIGLADGSEITLLTDWNKRREGKILREMWRAACGPFGTVLGPEANAAHRDHFHFDIARYRSGPYCR